MIQKMTFSNGGFVLHRVTIPGSVCRFSAWYDATGVLTDAERIDSRERSHTVQRGARAWTELQLKGRIHR